MIADYQIRERLARYLHKEISLEQFEDWLVQRSWNMHLDSDKSAQKLASAIELHLAEYSSGHLDESGLRNELIRFFTKYSVQISFGGGMPVVSEPPNNTTVKGVLQVAFPGRRIPRPAEAEFSGTSPVAVFE